MYLIKLFYLSYIRLQFYQRFRSFSFLLFLTTRLTFTQNRTRKNHSHRQTFASDCTLLGPESSVQLELPCRRKPTHSTYPSFNAHKNSRPLAIVWSHPHTRNIIQPKAQWDSLGISILMNIRIGNTIRILYPSPNRAIQ